MKIKVHSKLYWNKWAFWLIQPRPYKSLDSHDRYWVTPAQEFSTSKHPEPRMVDVPKGQYMIMQQPQIEIEIKEPAEIHEPKFSDDVIDPEGNFIPKEELSIHPNLEDGDLGMF